VRISDLNFFIFPKQTNISIEDVTRESAKYVVTNGSKTTVMDVVSPLRVSLDSSTAQLHDSLGSRNACTIFRIQRLISVVKIATVLEICTAEEQRYVVLFFWAKGLNAKNIHKECFSIYGGKCLSRKSAHSWVENISLLTKRLKRI
jgi:hypothetical protein